MDVSIVNNMRTINLLFSIYLRNVSTKVILAKEKDGGGALGIKVSGIIKAI